MTSVVINDSYGGFALSTEAVERLRDAGVAVSPYGRLTNGDDIDRADPELVRVVRDLGRAAGSDLAVVEVPEGVEWHIHEYDGLETVHENHRSWNSEGEVDYC